MQRIGRRWRRWLVGSLLFVILGVLMTPWVVSWMLPGGIVHAPNQGRAIDPKRDADFVPTGARHLRVTVGPPLATLSCLVLDPAKGSAPKATVFLLHGIRDRKESLLGTARRLAKKGMRAVLVDHRGHGRSTGNYLSYGALEGRDMKQVVLRLEQLELLARPLHAVGFSYGGSVAIQLAARERRIEKVVSISTFSSLRAVVPNYLETFLPGLHRLVSTERLERGIAEAGRQAGFDPEAADTAAAAAKTRAKILLLHGADDRKIYPAHAHRLLKAIGKRGKLIMVANEGHDSMMADKTGRVRRALDGWLEGAGAASSAE